MLCELPKWEKILVCYDLWRDKSYKVFPSPTHSRFIGAASEPKEAPQSAFRTCIHFYGGAFNKSDAPIHIYIYIYICIFNYCHRHHVECGWSGMCALTLATPSSVLVAGPPVTDFHVCRPCLQAELILRWGLQACARLSERRLPSRSSSTGAAAH